MVELAPHKLQIGLELGHSQKLAIPAVTFPQVLAPATSLSCEQVVKASGMLLSAATAGTSSPFGHNLHVSVATTGQPQMEAPIVWNSTQSCESLSTTPNSDAASIHRRPSS
jgi:hypothetical protein